MPEGPPVRVEILSGLGKKAPACIRLRTGRRVWLLDVGSGPGADAPFRPEWLHGADAVFISHDHVDHIGGAGHAVRAGLPIWCTSQTARALPPGAQAIAAEGGLFRRWNVHPPLHDQIAMIRHLQARRYAPLFCNDPAGYLSEADFDAAPMLDGRRQP